MNTVRFSPFALLLFISFSAIAQEPPPNKSKRSSLAHNVYVGSVAGTAEVGANMPLILWKNLKQQGKQGEFLNLLKGLCNSQRTPHATKNATREILKSLYRGLAINGACMVPTTGAQIGIDETLKQSIPGSDLTTSYMRNGIAGCCGALFANPTELVVINQQNEQQTARTVIRNLYRQHGLRCALRGCVPKAGRDGIFCGAFLTEYPRLKKKYLKEGDNEITATCKATTQVAPPTAAASQWLDTISTRMQADVGRRYVRGSLHTASVIYAQKGLLAFFAGLVPRTMRMMIAIPLMNEVKDKLTQIKENKRHNQEG